MITCVRKIRILLLKVEECPDFSILQSNYPYVAPMEELASTLKVWIFPNFCHFPWIFASRQRNAPGFSGIFAYIRIFSSIGGGGTDINWNHPGLTLVVCTSGETLIKSQPDKNFNMMQTNVDRPSCSNNGADIR